MNQEKVKNTILMEMERFSDKTSEGYHQMKAVLNKFPYKITADYQQLLDTLRGGTAINRCETLDELIMMLKQERVITREIVESCLYFQQNSDNVINQIHLFDLLMVPTRNLTEQLNLLTSLTNSLSVDGDKFFHENVLFSINKIKLSTDEIEKKIKEICIELQYGMDSAKVKEDILARTFELLNEGSVKYQQLVNMELDYEEGCREIVIDGFFGMMPDPDDKYKWFFDFLRDDKIISKLLQRKNLSEAEKKTYISIATNHSDSPFIGNSIPYFKKINIKESTIITKKRILDQELVYLIAKEVTPELAVKYDEILRGEEQGTVEVMTQIYVESQSTLVKESVRQHVNTSFKETDRLEFYKKSIIEKLKKENRLDLGDQLEDLLNSGAKIDRFDRFYRLLNSPESKKQLSYLGRLVFGENQWHKFETVQAFKEELKETEAKKNSSLSEMMKKDLSEIENQRYMNGLRSIDNKLANNDYLKQLKPEQIATIMLQLKVNYPNWTEKNFEQVNNQLSTYLNEEDKIQTNKILNEKEVILRISAISMEMGEKAQTIILAPTDKIKALDIVGEVRKDLKKQKVDYLFPIILETINHTYVSPNNLLVSDVNRQIEELLIKDEHCCSQVVLSFLVYSSGVFKNINPKYTAGYLNKDSEHQQNRGKIKRLVESFEKLHSHRQEMKQLKELNIDVEPTPMPQGTSNQSLISNSVKEPERKKEQPKEKSAGIEPTLTPLGISNHSLTDKQTKTPLVIKNQTFEEQMNQSTNVADSLNQEKSAGIQSIPIPKEIRDQSLTNKSPQTPNSHPVIKIQTLEERMNQSTNKANNLNEMKEAGKNQSSVRELKN
ncbi:Uncharacterised protein [Enterococcus hirae]|uniref:hypothetical protein n=1 Tax=Enterococcus hirae TaxID=1354 RepID=UPI0010E6B85F|nr:hypothetical protein [Enterococcus hirae]VTS86527.1 Uncharacterised protein [Enterococcus hirae]